jgi:protein phosphatase
MANEDAVLIADLTADTTLKAAAEGSFSIGAGGFVLAVSDGMGGAAAGEVASRIAVASMRELLAILSPDLSIPEQLRSAAQITNHRIVFQARQNPSLKGMGATLTAALIFDGVAYIAQIGDSRAYLIRYGRIRQITRDQTLVQMLLDSGAIKPSEVNSVRKNVIVQALGNEMDLQVALTSIKLYRDDCLLLCSDGLSNKLEAEEMKSIVDGSTDLRAACRKMIDMANDRGGEDNITVIVAKLAGAALDSTGDHKITEGLELISPFAAH